jgi:hypothetical protein
MIIYFLLLLTVAIIELVTSSVYGSFVSKQITDTYMDLDESKLRLNMYDSTILGTGKNFISTLPFSIFSKYYINNVGVIPRWSRLHKKVNEYFKNVSSRDISPY